MPRLLNTVPKVSSKFSAVTGGSLSAAAGPAEARWLRNAMRAASLQRAARSAHVNPAVRAASDCAKARLVLSA